MASAAGSAVAGVADVATSAAAVAVAAAVAGAAAAEQGGVLFAAVTCNNEQVPFEQADNVHVCALSL